MAEFIGLSIGIALLIVFFYLAFKVSEKCNKHRVRNIVKEVLNGTKRKTKRA
jgi:hypothetical protein